MKTNKVEMRNAANPGPSSKKKARSLLPRKVSDRPSRVLAAQMTTTTMKCNHMNYSGTKSLSRSGEVNLSPIKRC